MMDKDMAGVVPHHTADAASKYSPTHADTSAFGEHSEAPVVVASSADIISSSSADDAQPHHHATIRDDEQETPQIHKVYVWLNPRNPHQAQRRAGNVWRKARKHFILSLSLLVVGILLLCCGVGVLIYHDGQRAFALWVAGFVTVLPGGYGTYILYSYVRGAPGYTWRMLPELEY